MRLTSNLWKRTSGGGQQLVPNRQIIDEEQKEQVNQAWNLDTCARSTNPRPSRAHMCKEEARNRSRSPRQQMTQVVQGDARMIFEMKHVKFMGKIMHEACKVHGQVQQGVVAKDACTQEAVATEAKAGTKGTAAKKAAATKGNSSNIKKRPAAHKACVHQLVVWRGDEKCYGIESPA